MRGPTRPLGRVRALRVVLAYELLIRLRPNVEPGGGLSLASGAAWVDALPAPRASRLRWLAVRVGVLRLSVIAAVASVFVLELWAIRVNYGLRVTSDTPTFLALLREMTLHPLQPVSPFVPGAALQTSHATPYMQGLAWIWDHAVASHDAAGHPLTDPVAAYRFLALVGVGVTAALLHACFLWVRRSAGTRAAWISIPVLLLLFGPAHVIWAGDLTFQGFLYASFYPQTLALALLLYTLVLLQGDARLLRTAIAVVTVAATMVVHPFTGALLALLLATEGAWRAVRGGDWIVPSFALAAGYLAAAQWPAYSLDHALAVAGPSGGLLVAVCVVLPFVVWLFARTMRALGLLPPARSLAASEANGGDVVLLRFAVAGLVLVGLLAVWEVWLLLQPLPDPLVHSNRLALYWVEDRWRWPLMFAAGAAGLVGLTRLARRGMALGALWFAGCFGIGIAGIAGAPLPVWWRFLLFCQLPLALGVADALARSTSSAAKRVVGVTFAFVFVFKVATLVALPKQFTYWGSPLQPAYALGSVLPPGPSLVVSDPFTAYYVPGASGHRVLSVTKAHVGSEEELSASERGYRLLHEYYIGNDWWAAAQEMWKRGVRYVVVEKHTSLAPTTLADFSTGPTPLIRTASQRRQLGTYFYRNNRVGTLIHDSPTYAVYRLDPGKLFP
jgi:hypothetical protein